MPDPTLAEARDRLERLALAPMFKADLAVVLSALDRAAEALGPFADLGLPFTACGPADDSVWAKTSDEVMLQVGATYQHGWSIKVGNLRRAASIHAQLTQDPHPTREERT